MKLSDLDNSDVQLISGPQEMPAASQPSTASDMLSGVEKGIGGDIISGGEQAGLDAAMRLTHALGLTGASPVQVNQALKQMGIHGDVGPTSEKQMYRQSANEANKQYGEAQARSPWAFGAGELGGMGLGIMGGEGALGALGVGSKLVQAPKGAGFLTRMGAHAVNAAPSGAVIGAMQSKGNLIDATPDEQKQMLWDAGKGALTGSAIGAGVGLLGEAGSALLNKTGMGQRIKGMYNLGAEGADLSSPETPAGAARRTGTLAEPESLDNAIALHDQRAAQSVVGGIQEANQLLGKQMDEAVNNATQEGIVMKAGPELSEKIDQLFKHEAIAPEAEAGLAQETGEAAEMPEEETGEAKAPEEQKMEAAPDEESEEPGFQAPEFKRFYDYAKQFKEEGLSPVEIRDFIQKLYKSGRQLYAKDPAIANDAYELAGNLNGMLKTNVPKYAQAAERFDQFNKATSETLLSKNIPIETSNIRLSRTRNANAQVLKNMTNVIKGLNNPNDRVAQGTFVNLLKGLRDFNSSELARKAQQMESNPNFKTIFEQLGIQPEQIEQFIRDKAYRSHLIQTYSGTPNIPMGAGGDIMAGVKAVGKGADYLANKAGKIFGKATSNPVVNTSKKLYAANDDALKSLADRLGTLPGQKPVADALTKAIADKDTLAKNAILFTIMQNPNLRNVADSDNLIVGN